MHKENQTMKSASRILASVATFTLVHVCTAQTQTPAASPVQTISQSEFSQMVQEGQKFVPITPAAMAEQKQQMQAANQANLAIVNQFISQNPNLASLAALYATPTDPSVTATSDGNYQAQVTNAQGVVETVEMMGPGTILADLASSIQAASDPVQQLALYQSLYLQYSALYSKYCATPGVAPSASCANTVPPSALTNPATMQNASLGAIKTALQTLGSQASGILKNIPFPHVNLGSPFASCSADTGASLKATQVNFGDQTGNSGCSGIPSTSGILGNFSWPGKDNLTCVKSQGSRGTCHIFASTSAVEEIVARETGKHVNLSEEDFHEHEKLIWDPDWFDNGGSAYVDLNNASKNGYQFAWENQWDYNPSLHKKAYEYSCENYAYPTKISGVLEPGCSDSAPQAPEWCVGTGADCSQDFFCESIGETMPVLFPAFCYFTVANLSGTNSPYVSNGATSIWDPSDKATSFENIILNLASNNAVVLAFSETPAFGDATSHGGYVQYSSSDANTKGGAGHVVHIVAYIDLVSLAGNSNIPASEVANAAAGLGGYLVIKNSWSECNGDAGYYYMPVAYLEARATGVSVVSSVTY
jgi:C1A family cysteine protease